MRYLNHGSHYHTTRTARKMLFFFQAEVGIRDIGVTGVQTCALPICPCPAESAQLIARGRPQVGRFGSCLSCPVPPERKCSVSSKLKASESCAFVEVATSWQRRNCIRR